MEQKPLETGLHHCKGAHYGSTVYQKPREQDINLDCLKGFPPSFCSLSVPKLFRWQVFLWFSSSLLAPIPQRWALILLMGVELLAEISENCIHPEIDPITICVNHLLLGSDLEINSTALVSHKLCSIQANYSSVPVYTSANKRGKMKP